MNATGDKAYTVCLSIYPGLSDTTIVPNVVPELQRVMVDEEARERVTLTFTLRGKVGKLPRYVLTAIVRTKEEQ